MTEPKLELHSQNSDGVLVLSPDAASLGAMLQGLIALERSKDHVLDFLYSHTSVNHGGVYAQWAARAPAKQVPRRCGENRHQARLPWQNECEGPLVIDAALDPEIILCQITKALQRIHSQLSHRFLWGDRGLPAICRKGYAGLPVKALSVSYPHSGWSRSDWSDKLGAVCDRASEKWKPDTLWVGSRLYSKLASLWGYDNNDSCLLFGYIVATCVSQLPMDEGYFFPSHAVDVRSMLTSGLVSIELHGSLLTLEIPYAFVFTDPSTFAHLWPMSL